MHKIIYKVDKLGDSINGDHGPKLIPMNLIFDP